MSVAGGKCTAPRDRRQWTNVRAMPLRLVLPVLAVVLLTACAPPPPDKAPAPVGNPGFDQYHRACEIALGIPVDPDGLSPEETDAWVGEVTKLAEIAVQGFDPDISELADALLDGIGDDPAADIDEATALMEGMSGSCGRLQPT